MRESLLIDDLEKAGLWFLVPKGEPPEDEPRWGEEKEEDEPWLAKNMLDPTEYDYYDEKYAYANYDSEFAEEYAGAFEGDEGEGCRGGDGEWTWGDLAALFDVDADGDLPNRRAWNLFDMTRGEFEQAGMGALRDAAAVERFLANMKDASLSALPSGQRGKAAVALAICGRSPFALSGAMASPGDAVSYFGRAAARSTPEEGARIADMLCDYERFLPDAMEMDRRRGEAGEAPFGYTPFPKPSRLADLHRKAANDFMAMESERRSDEEKAMDADIARVTGAPAFRGLLRDREGEKFAVIAPRDCADVRREGRILSHCVGAYVSKFAAGKTWILFARRKPEVDDPLFTLEVSPPGMAEPAALLQCYGLHDSTDKTDALRDFLRKWAQEAGVDVRCMI